MRFVPLLLCSHQVRILRKLLFFSSMGNTWNLLVAWITGSDLPEGITEMTVPVELDGYMVNYVGMAAIPQTVQTVYVPQGCFVRTEQEPNRTGLKILEKKK